jgi:hypothetical protein
MCESEAISIERGLRICDRLEFVFVCPPQLQLFLYFCVKSIYIFIDNSINKKISQIYLKIIGEKINFTE